jgi:8-oxo-dGTP diphosphatase
MEGTVFGVKGLMINSQGRCLVLRKPNGDFDIPGGRVESLESFDLALYRELLEETGLRARVCTEWTHWSFMKGPGLRVLGVTYICSVMGGNLRLSSEHSDYHWCEWQSVGGLKFKWPYLVRTKDEHSDRIRSICKPGKGDRGRRFEYLCSSESDRRGLRPGGE